MNIALYTKEGMMQKLKEFKILIPESLQFDTIYSETIRFRVKNTDSALKQQLDNYYCRLVTYLKVAGRNESQDQKNQNTGGIVKTSFRYKKQIGNGKYSEILLASEDYFENARDYVLFFSYYTKY